MGAKLKSGLLVVVVAVVLLPLYFFMFGNGSVKHVAKTYAEAYLSDFNAKKVISCMSDDYISARGESKKILTNNFKKWLKEDKEDMKDRYGKNFKVKIKYVDKLDGTDEFLLSGGYSVYPDIYFGNDDKDFPEVTKVCFSVTESGKGDDYTYNATVYLVKEGLKWRVVGEEF